MGLRQAGYFFARRSGRYGFEYYLYNIYNIHNIHNIHSNRNNYSNRGRLRCETFDFFLSELSCRMLVVCVSKNARIGRKASF